MAKDTMRPNLGRLTLDQWRNGPPWDSRLHMLADHYASQYGANPAEVYAAARALMFDGEEITS